MKPYCLLFAIPFAACSAGGGGGFRFDLSTVHDLGGSPSDQAGAHDFANPPLDFSTPPQPDMAMAKKPTSSSCVADTECIGKTPACLTLIGQKNAPGGYCSTGNCAADGDCGYAGAYCAQGGHCYLGCSMKNECQQINAGNRCFYGGPDGVCLPTTFTMCDPTQNACACIRTGYDDVGRCYTKCTLPNNCANGDNCVYYNGTIDVNGMATGDTINTPICVTPGQTAAGQACMYVEDCVSGYECDYFSSGGAKLCRQVCKSGTTVCGVGTCKNAFKLLNFGVGSIGLCY
jgi:hypothetical protein